VLALVTLIGEAVFARCLSSIKAERTRASKVLAAPKKEPFRGDKKQFIDDLEQALYASKIMSYTQGFMLMRETAKEQGWALNYAGIARMWRGGCIIKVLSNRRALFIWRLTIISSPSSSRTLRRLSAPPPTSSPSSSTASSRMVGADYNLRTGRPVNSTTAVAKASPGWRRVIAQAVLWGIPTPAFSTALAFFDGYRSEILPANLLQAQRDFFGAHTFRVLPGKENAKLKAGEDIRKFASPLCFALLMHRFRHQLDWPRRQCVRVVLLCLSVDGSWRFMLCGMTFIIPRPR
jgi:6-phosphogluconate dehydrogenase